MFAQSLYTQWKWNRDFLAVFTAIGFAAPLFILWIAIPELGFTSARELVSVGHAVGGTVVSVSVLVGVVVAWQGYNMDNRAGHIYALSLPVTRPRFLLIRAASAAVILALPVVGIWVGTMLAAGQVALPSTLHAYTGALAGRALLAAWLAHACMFALRYFAGRRARVVLSVLIIGAIMVALTMIVAPVSRGPIVRAGNFLISSPGPFGVWFGRWTMIDV